MCEVPFAFRWFGLLLIIALIGIVAWRSGRKPRDDAERDLW